MKRYDSNLKEDRFGEWVKYNDCNLHLIESFVKNLDPEDIVGALDYFNIAPDEGDGYKEVCLMLEQSLQSLIEDSLEELRSNF